MNLYAIDRQLQTNALSAGSIAMNTADFYLSGVSQNPHIHTTEVDFS